MVMVTATESNVHDALHSNISITPTNSAYTLQTDTADSTVDVNMDGLTAELTDKLSGNLSSTSTHTNETL